ncbi:MAG: S-layer homology domain-containing protein [Firmicutes bacterium]|nr:S-layer homology domain-containing protein [Bacillota bacterium]
MKNKNVKHICMVLAVMLLLALLAGCGMQTETFVIHEDGSISYTTGFYYSEDTLTAMETTPETLFAGKTMVTREYNGKKYYAAKEDLDTYELSSGIEAINARENAYFWFEEKTVQGVDGPARFWECTFSIPSIEKAADSSDTTAQTLEGMFYAISMDFPHGLKAYPVDNYDEKTDCFYFPVQDEDQVVVISGWLDEYKPLPAVSVENAITTVKTTMDTPKAGVINSKVKFTTEVACNGKVVKDAILSSEVHWEHHTGEDKDRWMSFDCDPMMAGDAFVKGEYYLVSYTVLIDEKYDLEMLGAVLFNGSQNYNVNEYEHSITQTWTFGPVAGAVNPFKDVPSGSYYEDAVLWAFYHDPQITDGTSPTTFSPDKTCTRGQVVTFLWRVAGCPEPKSTKNPFTDVKSSDWFYKPVLWAVEQGITDGTSPTTFSPTNPCTNAHILTFIHRAVGTPAVSAAAVIDGVSDPIGTAANQKVIDALKKEASGMAEWCRDSFVWASFNGLLEGSYTGKYDAKAPCPRKNVVYYLYNMDFME